MKTTQTMLTLVVTDVGERGGAVTIRVYLPGDREAWFCALDLDAGMQSVRDLAARELWGKDQPKTTGPAHVVVPAPEEGSA